MLRKQWLAPGSREDLWGQSMYLPVPYEAVPPLPFARFDGSFRWLPAVGEPFARLGLNLDPDEPPRIKALVKRAGLSLPASFATFISNPAIHGRVISTTCCFLDLSTELMRGPDGAMYLRFMNDQQWCVSWFLGLAPDGSHTVAWAFPRAADDRNEDSERDEDIFDADQLTFCAGDFEEFICRFWIENAIDLAYNRGYPWTKEMSEYLKAVGAARLKADTIRARERGDVTDAIATALLQILEQGILRIRRSADDGDAKRCRIEADHVVEIPGILMRRKLVQAEFYFQESREGFMQKVPAREREVFEAPWRVIEEALRSGRVR